MGKWIAIFLTAALALCGCTEEQEMYEQRPVLEGWIDSDGYPRVLFSISFVEDDEETIADKIVRWGLVTLSDGDTTVILTGGPDKYRFPPFSYYTYELTGQPGKTYTIDATYENYHARATAVMPAPPVVAEVKSVPAADCDTLRDVTLFIQAPQEFPAYYHISTRVLPEETTYHPAVLGLVKATEPGELLEVQVFRGKSSLHSKDFKPRIPSNRNVLVKVERVCGEVYRFWENFNEATLFGNSLFTGPADSLEGNVEGGYGYWSPQGVTIVRLDAEK